MPAILSKQLQAFTILGQADLVALFRKLGHISEALGSASDPLASGGMRRAL